MITQITFRHPDLFLAAVGACGGALLGIANSGPVVGALMAIFAAAFTYSMAHLDLPSHHPHQ